MRFHDFVNAKHRIEMDLIAQSRPSATSTIVGLSNANAIALANAQFSALKKLSNNDVLTTAARRPFDFPVAPGAWRKKIIGDAAREHIGVLMEYEWCSTDRPFYNVYPIVEKLIHNTKLAVSAAFLRFPHRTMLFRFAEGHEPYGIKSVLITIGQPHVAPADTQYFNSRGVDVFSGVCGSAMVQYTKPLPDEWFQHEVYLLSGAFEIVPEPDDRPYEPHFFIGNTPESSAAFDEKARQYQALQSPDGLRAVQGTESRFSHGPTNIQVGDVLEQPCRLATIEDTIRDQHDPAQYDGERLALYMGYQSFEVHQFVFKLAAFASMLHQGNDLITPVVLSKHQARYDVETDEAAKKWLEDKAAQIQGRGFSIGKELYAQSLVSPHLRNAHMALFWTGPGRKVPKLLLRAGSVVTPKHLSRVPTGYLGEEKPDEQPPSTANEHVYFLHEQHRNYIKIGRTRRSVRERQRESNTFVPGGLRLVGYIPTGDCVALETRLHREYGEKRRENEFFDMTVEEARGIIVQFGGVCAPDNAD